MMAPTNPQELPLSGDRLKTGIGPPFLAFRFAVCSGPFPPGGVGMMMFSAAFVGAYMTLVWALGDLLCVLPLYVLGRGDRRCASHWIKRSFGGSATAGDNPESWDQGASVSAVRSADALVAIALAYAVSAALVAAIAMAAWAADAMMSKMRRGVLIDWPVEKEEQGEQDGEDDQDEKEEQGEKAERLAPAEAIGEGCDDEARRIDDWRVNGRNAVDKDDGHKHGAVLPASDHDENTYTDTNTTSDQWGAADNVSLMAVSFWYVAVATYQITHSLRRALLVWRVRGTIATMTLSPIMWELFVIRLAAVEPMLRRNRRDVVIAAAMGAASCVRLLLLLWLLGTALLGSRVELSRDL